jgi:hypothetical protein
MNQNLQKIFIERWNRLLEVYEYQMMYLIYKYCVNNYLFIFRNLWYFIQKENIMQKIDYMRRSDIVVDTTYENYLKSKL